MCYWLIWDLENKIRKLREIVWDDLIGLYGFEYVKETAVCFVVGLINN